MNLPNRSKRLGQLYDYSPLNKYEGLQGKTKVRAPTTYVGVEVELEKVKCKYRTLPSSIRTHTDGSLKVDGMEFVTVPIRVCYLENELIRLFASIEEPLISSRCSVHVHLNVRDMTQEELYRFLLLYLIFEKSLFNFSGYREDNIFCTPLYSQINRVSHNIYRLLYAEGIMYMEWSKYFSLNLCTIWGNDNEGSSRFGTVEFRHMAGTKNVEKIIEWINLIVSLKITAKRMTTEELVGHIRVMNTSSGYAWLARETFQSWSDIILSQDSFKDDVEHGVLMAKMCSTLKYKSTKHYKEGQLVITKETICVE